MKINNYAKLLDFIITLQKFVTSTGGGRLLLLLLGRVSECKMIEFVLSVWISKCPLPVGQPVDLSTKIYSGSISECTVTQLSL